MINWHRLFGIFLTDYFTGTPYTVELEKDLSLQQQFLDVVILRKEQSDYQGKLADGLDNLKTHNLVSYKSMQESFDIWAMQELIGHYVNYRKQVTDKLLPESEFSLYAVSTRFPVKLAKQIRLTQLISGVYEFNDLGNIRLIVLTEIAQAEHNAVWHLFSHNIDKIKFGMAAYHSKIPASTIVNVLYENYQLEGLSMAYTLEDFYKEVAREHLHYLSVDEVLKQFPTSEVLKQFPTDEVLKQLPTDEVLEQLSEDVVLEHYSVNQRLKGLSKEEVLAYLLELERQPYSDKN